MQLRYRYRLEPAPRHVAALARAFGCAGWCSTTPCAPASRRTRPGYPALPMRNCHAGTSPPSASWRPTRPRCPRPSQVNRPRAHSLRRPVGRPEDRRSAVPAPRGEEGSGAGSGGPSRKQKGSRNRDKARLKVARAHARVADARRDFHHQLSTRLIRDNQAIAVEDLAVKGLRPHPAGQVRPRRRMVGASWPCWNTRPGCIGRRVPRRDRPVHPDLADLLACAR